MPYSDGGYGCEFVDVPHDDDHCVICLLPARDPQQTKCECARLYCKSCYDKLKTTSETCPTCRQPLDAFPDRNIARRIKGLRVKCTSTGCPWINELGSLHDHLQTCGYVLVLCSNGCKEYILRDKHLLHCVEQCPLRRHMCEHCKAEGPYKEMIGGHLDKCPDLMVPCPNSGCEVSIKRKDMASHDLECPHETISCPYKDAGCTYTSPRQAMEHHKATSCGHHLDLAMVQLKDAMVQLKDVKVELKDAMVQLKDVKVELKDAMVQLKDVKVELKDAMVQQKKHGEKFTEMHCTPLVIKMSQFSQLKVNNKRWYSPGFYTHTCGYKMCFSVDANGYGAGKGTHVSEFLHLMKGENDDALTWPIKYKCTFTLLNQLKDEGHHTVTINSPEGKDDIALNLSRVLSGDKGTTGWGCPQFIAHTKLDLQEEEQCQYLKDDSLYFRVKVELKPAVKPWLVPILPCHNTCTVTTDVENSVLLEQL